VIPKAYMIVCFPSNERCGLLLCHPWTTGPVRSGVSAGRILKKTQPQTSKGLFPSSFLLQSSPHLYLHTPLPTAGHGRRTAQSVSLSHLPLSFRFTLFLCTQSSRSCTCLRNPLNTHPSRVEQPIFDKDRKNKSMPPKKVVKEEPVQLGRPGNSLNAGIVCTN
jgi:hypothetical protein